MQITANGKILDLSTPTIMGVLNLNHDSFYEGSRVTDVSQVVDIAGEMITAGAQIIDIGGMSSKPGSVAPPISEEIRRVQAPLKALRKAFPLIFISIDTFRSEVLEVAAAEGVDMVNDISAGELDESFIDTVAASGLPYVLMHMQGSPVTMQDKPTYDEVVLEIISWLRHKKYQLQQRGVHDIIIDPGFGFGKSINDNYLLLKHLSSFEILDCPIMIGLSRKSMLHKLLAITPAEALNATTAAHMIALMNGTSILRVHDVKEAAECVTIFNAYLSA